MLRTASSAKSTNESIQTLLSLLALRLTQIFLHLYRALEEIDSLSAGVSALNMLSVGDSIRFQIESKINSFRDLVRRPSTCSAVSKIQDTSYKFISHAFLIILNDRRKFKFIQVENSTIQGCSASVGSRNFKPNFSDK